MYVTGRGPCGSAAAHDTVTWADAPRSLADTDRPDRRGRPDDCPVVLAGCRVEPLALELRTEGVRVGPESAPVLVADGAAARLAPIQALGAQLVIDRVRLVRPRLVLTDFKQGFTEEDAGRLRRLLDGFRAGKNPSQASE